MGRRLGGIDPAVGVEALEPRLLMSGNVVVTMADGDVLVRGDRADNAVVVDQDGLADGQIRLVGADGTTINGQAEMILDDVVGVLTFDLRRGDDAVALDGVTLVGDLTALGGRGDNTVVLTDVDIAGDVTIRNRRGADTFELTGASRIGDDLTIDNRSGGATTTITGVSDDGDPPTITPVEIAGNVSVLSRRGATVATLEHVTIGGDMDVWNGRGFDVLELLGHTRLSGTLRAHHRAGGSTTRLVGDDRRTEEMEFNWQMVGEEPSGRVEVEQVWLGCGRGADEVVLDYVTIDSDVTVRLGGGADSVRVTAVDVGGQAAIETGGGADRIMLESRGRWVGQEVFGTKSQFRQSAAMDLGPGRDELLVGNDLYGPAHLGSVPRFHTDSVFTGGGGRDRLVLDQVWDRGITPVFQGFEPF